MLQIPSLVLPKREKSPDTGVGLKTPRTPRCWNSDTGPTDEDYMDIILYQQELLDEYVDTVLKLSIKLHKFQMRVDALLLKLETQRKIGELQREDLDAGEVNEDVTD